MKITDANDATGVLVEGGRTGEVKLSGAITIDESTEIKDADSDGDNDGPFATGARRFGVRVTGPAPFNGSITQTAGTITVEGADSAGISVESALNGAIRTAGAISVTGDRSFGVHAASTVAASGGRGITALGEGAVGLARDDNVGGRLTSVRRSPPAVPLPTPPERRSAKLDADDLLQGGPPFGCARCGGRHPAGRPAGRPIPTTQMRTTTASPTHRKHRRHLVFGGAPALLVARRRRRHRPGGWAGGGDGFGVLLRAMSQLPVSMTASRPRRSSSADGRRGGCRRRDAGVARCGQAAKANAHGPSPQRRLRGSHRRSAGRCRRRPRDRRGGRARRYRSTREARWPRSATPRDHGLHQRRPGRGDRNPRRLARSA